MKLFVWDLHGTLEQGNEHAVMEMSNQVLASFGYNQQFNSRHAAQLYGLKWYQYFEFLLPAEPAEKHIALQAACFALSNSSEGTAIIAKHMQPSRNAVMVLDAIRQKHEQVLISNTVPESLPKFIDALGMRRFFAPANALAVNQHAREAKRTKHDALTGYTKHRQYDEIIVVGDSESDMRLAQAAGAKAYLYAHAGSTFRSNLGDHKINDLKEVLQEL